MQGIYRSSLLAILMALITYAAAAEEQRQLTFVVSYQGLFTAGMEVDIGRIDLQLEATDSRQQEVLMRASTRDFDTAELIKRTNGVINQWQPNQWGHKNQWGQTQKPNQWGQTRSA